jgi:hypothetical protein
MAWPAVSGRGRDREKEKEKETMHRECLGGERIIKKYQGAANQNLKIEFRIFFFYLGRLPLGVLSERRISRASSGSARISLVQAQLEY